MQEFGPCTVNSCHRVSSGYASSGVPCLRSWRTFVFVVILFPVYSFALNSSVIGTVSDPTGRPIADASVELVDANGALRVKAVSGSAGKFQLAAPALSECTLIVKAAGFQTVSKRLVNSPEEKQYQVTFSLAIRAIESVIVTADVNHVDLFSPILLRKCLFNKILSMQIPAVRERPCLFRAIPLRPHLAESRHRNTLLRASREITANPSLSSLRSAHICCRTVFPQTLTATDMPIRTSSFQQPWRTFTSMEARSTYLKPIIRLTLQPPMHSVSKSIHSSRSQATTATSISQRQ